MGSRQGQERRREKVGGRWDTSGNGVKGRICQVAAPPQVEAPKRSHPARCLPSYLSSLAILPKCMAT